MQKHDTIIMSGSAAITEARRQRAKRARAAINEARRQAEICNACRYCEGYCSVFPSLFSMREFADADITHFANLCHNCRGCYYACQYTPPHEFAINFPRALAEVRNESWRDFAWPRGFAVLFHRNGVLIAALLVAASAGFLFMTQGKSGDDFYAYLSHSAMVLIFTPAFILPLIAAAISIRRYVKTTAQGITIGMGDVMAGLRSATTMKNLSGGHGAGCNFESGDRFTPWRRIFHHCTLYGFLMCFASTTSATVMHYGFDWIGPYGFFTPPKLLGVPGGIILCIGTAGLAWLKNRADSALDAKGTFGGDMAFILLLFGVSFTGLLLYSLTGTAHIAWALPIHLGFVAVFFVLTPYSKMVHGFYRLAALAVDAARGRRRRAVAERRALSGAQ